MSTVAVVHARFPRAVANFNHYVGGAIRGLNKAGHLVTVFERADLPEGAVDVEILTAWQAKAPVISGQQFTAYRSAR